MRTGRPIPPLKITAPEREMLEHWARGHDRRLASRASAILAAADGVSNKDVAARCGMTKQTVGKWRARFRDSRLQGLYDEPRPGAPRRIRDEQVARVIRLTSEPAPNGSPWTTRSMAQAVGLTQTAISRIWRLHGVRPPSGNGGGREAAPSGAGPRPDGHAMSPADDGDGARARTLTAMHNLLRDARALREACPPELDALLALAVDAIEGALGKQREPTRSSTTRVETALRNARNLLDQAKAAVEWSVAERKTAASTVAAMRSAAEGRRGAPPLRRCPSCGTRYTLRFTVRGMGGETVSASVACPRPRCGKPVQVDIPRNAERVRLEEIAPS